MRLICGFLHLDGRPAESGRLDAMAAAMVAPGLTPGLVRRIEGSVALAMLDFPVRGIVSAPVEALEDASGLLLAADVRLDEPDRLAEALGVPLPPAGAAGDETLLRAVLERWGADGLGRMLGDFAVVAWDPRSQRLTCGRDAFGVRPFFFLHRPGEVFAFASLSCGLRAGGFVARELDEDYLLAPLVESALGPERSLFRGVERLAPGGLLQVSAQRIERGCHWRLDAASAGRNAIRPEEAAEELTALVTEAVRCRLPAAGPVAGRAAGSVAAHLSGGLDSSALAILAARILRRQGRSLLGYSFLPSPLGAYDPPGERPYVEAVLRQEPDIVWTPVHVRDSAAYVLPDMDLDLALPYDSATPEAQVFADAAARGAGILLSGWGGDEGATFNGRGALAEALLAGRWRTLAGEFRALSADRGRSPLTALRGQLLPYLLPDEALVLVRRLLGRPPHPPRANAEAMLRPDLVARVSGERIFLGPDAAVNRLRLLSAAHLTRRAEDWAQMGARYGLAVAFPLLDRRVVAFALSLPSALFHRGGWTRRVFRDAMAGILPPEIRWRRGKLAPFTEGPALVAVQRDALLARLADLRRHPRVAALFDLDRLEEAVLALPTAETASQQARSLCEDDAFRARAIRILRCVRSAIYVQQHY